MPGCPPPLGWALEFDWPRYHEAVTAGVIEPDFPSPFTATERPRAVSKVVFTSRVTTRGRRESEVIHGRALLRFRDRGCHHGLFPGSRGRRRFDPFAPVWLFLVGYVQVYVIQALSYHDWAIDVRGKELVTAANFQAFWAVLWFLAVYHLGIGRRIAPSLPRPPRGWPSGLVMLVSPFLVLWGLYCAG